MLGLLKQSGINIAQPVNWSHPLNRGLRSAWLVLPQWRGGLRWRDLCCRNIGTLTNMDPATDWSGPRGRLGGYGSLDFDATNDEVRLASTVALSADFTLSIWFNRVSTSAVHGLFGNSAETTSIVRWAANATQLNVRTATDVLQVFALATVAGTWGHVVVTRTGSSLRAFLNGVESSTGAISDAGALNVNRIGMSHTSSWFSGQLDDARLYDARGWTAADVRQYYNLSRQGYPGLLNRTRRFWWAGASLPAGAFTLSAAAGAFTLSGTAATLKAGRRLTADAGAFALSGTAAGLFAGRKLTAAAGSFALSGTAAGLFAGRLLTGEGGAFAIDGPAAALLAGRRVSAAAGAYAWLGTDAALTPGVSVDYRPLRIVGTPAALAKLRGTSADLIRLRGD